MKIEVSHQQEAFIQVSGKSINNTYVFFPKILKKLGNREYEEIDFKDLAPGIQKYIKDNYL